MTSQPSMNTAEAYLYDMAQRGELKEFLSALHDYNGHTKPKVVQVASNDDVLARLIIDPKEESTPEAREEAANRAYTMKQAKSEITRLVDLAQLEAKAKKSIEQSQTETVKAYGGCTKCYGKGYASVNAAWSGLDTDTDIGSPGGRVSGGNRNAMKFCDCGRGRELAKRFNQSQLKARIDENQRYIHDVHKQIDPLPEWREYLPMWLKYYEDRIAELTTQRDKLIGSKS